MLFSFYYYYLDIDSKISFHHLTTMFFIQYLFYVFYFIFILFIFYSFFFVRAEAGWEGPPLREGGWLGGQRKERVSGTAEGGWCS